jgi:hypothetical protein
MGFGGFRDRGVPDGLEGARSSGPEGFLSSRDQRKVLAGSARAPLVEEGDGAPASARTKSHDLGSVERPGRLGARGKTQ